MVWSFAFMDGLEYTIGHKALDGDIRKIEYVDTTRDRSSCGGGFKPGDLNLGRAIKSDHLPTRIKREAKKFGIPDVVWALGMYFVNDKFKDVVERLELGVHQYFPMEMLWKDGTPAQEMYLFNICNRLDTVDREATTAELADGRMWLPETGKIVFSERRIDNHHIWIDKHIYAGTYMSDALHDALMEGSVTGLEFGKRPSVPGDVDHD